jgi:hypothetical protein
VHTPGKPEQSHVPNNVSRGREMEQGCDYQIFMERFLKGKERALLYKTNKNDIG